MDVTESDLDPRRSKHTHSILTICREIVLILYHLSEMLLILTSLSLNCLTVVIGLIHGEKINNIT